MKPQINAAGSASASPKRKLELGACAWADRRASACIGGSLPWTAKYTLPLRHFATLPLLFWLGCAYYNTFYNAQVLYRDGAKLVAADNRSSAKEKFDNAIKKSAAVIKDYPKSQWVDEALLMIGKCYYQLGDYTKAIAKFENLQAVFPNSRFRDEGKYYEALALIDDGQYAQGMQLLKELKEDSRDFREDAAFQLALTSFKQEDYPGAVKAFRDFEGEHPHSARCRELRRLVAEAYFHLGRYDEAVQAYCEHRQLAENSRARMGADLKIAECFLMANRPESTLVLMQRQPDRFTDYNDKINLLSGKAFLALGKKQEAHASLTKVRSGTDAAEADLLIGRSYEQDTNFASALAYYDSAKQRDANSVYAAQATQRRLLISRLLEGLKGATDTAEAQFLLAEVYHLNLQQDSQAVIRYQKVADSFPKSPYAAKALYAIAWIKAHNLQRPDSLLAYQQVVDHYPKTVYAQAARKTLGQPLLPDDQIEKPPPPKRDTARKVAGQPEDTSAYAHGRADSLAKPGAEVAEGGKTPPGGRETRRARGRERRERDRSTPEGDTSLLSRLRPSTAGGTPPAVKPGTKTEPPSGVSMPPALPPPKSSAAGQETTAKSRQPMPPPAKSDTGKAVPVKSESTMAAKPAEPETTANAPPAARPAKSEIPVSSVIRDTTLRPIHFGFDRAAIRPQDRRLLSALAEHLKQSPDSRLLISGYCDPRGDEEYNLELGLRRAEATRNWLIRNGIDPSRIEVESWGASAAQTEDPTQYWTERRCEFQVRKP